MNEHLIESAYDLAQKHYTDAELAVFKELNSKFRDEDFDTIHLAGKRAMQLHLAALNLAHKVSNENFPYEKSLNILQSQFSEIPAATCQRAFSIAHLKTR